jgi:hypothetical protein
MNLHVGPGRPERADFDLIGGCLLWAVC